MALDTVTFRLETLKRAELDAIAATMDRDRTYVLKQAVEAYLDAHRWQTEHIKTGLEQANAGEFATDEEVSAAFDQWRG